MSDTKYTPGPWVIRRGGGHKAASIVGSESIHTNGRERNKTGYSSASYSDEICEIHADLTLPGPRATAQLITVAPDLLDLAKRLANHCEQNNCPELQGLACDAFAAIAKANLAPGTK